MVSDADADAALAVAAAGGDRDALGAIYDRYADRLHDLCWSMLRDRHEAADALHDTFVVAASRLGQLRDPDRLRPWLFAIARREAIRRSERRKRVVPTADAGLDMSVVDEDTTGGADAATLVWEAADALAERDRAVLNLHVRQGLDGRDLADALGVVPDQAYVLLNRAKAQLGRAVGAVLLARHGRKDCAELDRLLTGIDGPLDPLARKRVGRHGDGCPTCGERRRSATEATAMLAAAPLVVAPAAARARTLGDAQLISSSHELPRERGQWRHDGFPVVADPDRRRLRLDVVLATLLIAVAVALIVLAGGEGDKLAPVDEPGATTITTVAGPGTTVAPVAPVATRRTATTRRGVAASTTVVEQATTSTRPTTSTTAPITTTSRPTTTTTTGSTTPPRG